MMSHQSFSAHTITGPILLRSVPLFLQSFLSAYEVLDKSRH
jgi:hypothetical protein